MTVYRRSSPRFDIIYNIARSPSSASQYSQQLYIYYIDLMDSVLKSAYMATSCVAKNVIGKGSLTCCVHAPHYTFAGLEFYRRSSQNGSRGVLNFFVIDLQHNYLHNHVHRSNA